VDPVNLASGRKEGPVERAAVVMRSTAAKANRFFFIDILAIIIGNQKTVYTA
jgi:hypothetical protein